MIKILKILRSWPQNKYYPHVWMWIFKLGNSKVKYNIGKVYNGLQHIFHKRFNLVWTGLTVHVVIIIVLGTFSSEER